MVTPEESAPYLVDWTWLRDWTWRPYEQRVGIEERRRERERQDQLVEEMVKRKAPSDTGREARKPMKSVYNVVVVSKRGEIILDKKVVAKDRDEALFEADVSGVLKAYGYRPGDVTMLCVKLGDVEVEPEPQRVQIVEPGPRRDRDDRPPQTGRFNA